MSARDLLIERTKDPHSVTEPVQCGKLRKGSYVLLGDTPCSIAQITFAKGGKHGASKAKIVGKGLLTGKTTVLNGVPSNKRMEAPVVRRCLYELIDCDEDGYLTVIDEEGNVRSDLSVGGGGGEVGEDKDSEALALTRQIRNSIADEGDERSPFVAVLSCMGVDKVTGVVLKDLNH